MKFNNLKTILLTLSFFLVACNNSDNEPESKELNQSLRQTISENNITALSTPSNTPAIDSAIVQLGKHLFFSKALSGDQDTACATCHHPNLGGGDNLALPIGVAAVETDLLGPGRLHDPTAFHHDGGPTVPRNAPTTFNFIFYSKHSFHDGRIENLSDPISIGGAGNELRTPDSPFDQVDLDAGNNIAAAQARFPVTSPEEMRGFNFEAGNDNQAVRHHLAERLQGNNNELATNNWLALFQAAFPSETDTTAEQLITFDNISFAIGEYERSQILIDNAWHEYLAGDDNALSDSAKRGAQLFYQSVEDGGFACASCHSGNTFTDEGFHNIAIPQVGRGKGDGLTNDADFGRFRETKVAADMFKFRTPSLLNVTITGPFGHDGAYIHIEDIIEHHLNPEISIHHFDPTQVQTGLQIDNWLVNTQAALSTLKQAQIDGKSLLPKLDYSQQDITDLVSFLYALEDPCTRDVSCMNKWVPSIEETDPDGLRLIAIDKNGNLL